MGRALEAERVGVRPDDEEDRHRAQHDAGLHGPGQHAPGEPCAVARPGVGFCCSGERLEASHAEEVPVGRKVAQPLLHVEGDLDVREGVTPERGERVLRCHGVATEQHGIPLGQPAGEGRLRRRRWRVHGHQTGESGVVDLAARQPRQLGEPEVAHVDGAHATVGETGETCRSGRHVAGGRDAVGAGDQRRPPVEAPHVVSSGPQAALDVVEVDPVAEHLGHPGPAAGDLEQTGLGPAAEVTGVQAVDGASEGEVGRVVGVTEHDVRAGVDDLPVDDVDVASRHRDADRAGVLGCTVRRKVGHARGRLGLAVHDEQVPSPATTQLGEGDHAVGVDAPPGLGDGAQVWKVEIGEPPPLEEVERVRHAGEGGHPGPTGQVPEARVCDGEVGEHDRGTGEQVTVDDAQAVAVVQGQARHRTIRGADGEVVRDRPGVAREVVPGEADQAG